jgi:hypothetical protein
MNLLVVPHTLIACLDSVLFPFGLVALNFAWTRSRAWRCLRRAATRPIAIRDARGGRIGIRGRIVAGPSGLLAAPSGGGGAVWVQIEFVSDGVEGPTRLLALTAVRDFLVEDLSGERAYVVAHGASVDVLENHDVPRDAPFVRALLDLRSGSNGIFARPGRGRLALCDVREAVLKPGQEVVVFGPSRREGVSSPSGVSSVSQLVMGREDGGGGTVFIGIPPIVWGISWVLTIFAAAGLMLIAISLLPIIGACLRLVEHGTASLPASPFP